MISFSERPVDTGAPWNYAAGFRMVPTFRVDRIAKCMTNFVWSPLVWEWGERRAENFLFSSFIVLDFDDGEMSLEGAVKAFCDCIHIIGTTKSHQVAKGSKPSCDRFRVLLRWAHPITDPRQYRYNMEAFVKACPIDESAIDTARYFFPCREIISISSDGFKQDVLSVPDDWGKTPRRAVIPGIVPSWVRWQLEQVIPEGERTITCYRMAKDLVRAGKTGEEILNMILTSKTYQGRPTPHALKKIREAITSGLKSVAKEGT